MIRVGDRRGLVHISQRRRLIVDLRRLRNKGLLGHVTLRRDITRIRQRRFRHIVV